MISLAAILVILLGLAVIMWKRIPIVLGLVALIISIYILQIASSADFNQISRSYVFWELAFAPSDIVTPSYIYTIFTSMFLHANLVHLLFNLFALYFIGSMLETRIGGTKFFIIYVIAGLIGGLTWAAIHWDQVIVAVGASGAIMGILGAFARLYGREKLRMLLFFFPLPPMPAFVIFLLMLTIDMFIALTGVGFIAAEAHLGGAIAGFVVAPFVAKLPGKEAGEKKEIRIHDSTLRKLAVTPELKDILEKIETETVPEVQDVWFQHFMKRARCPACGGRLMIKGDILFSDCGWRTRL